MWYNNRFMLIIPLSLLFSGLLVVWLLSTLFIATLDSELEVISVCNMSGEVIKETLGTRKRTTLSPSLASFLNSLKPVL